MRILLFLLAAAMLWVPSLHVFYRHGAKERGRELLARQATDVQDMRRVNPEWDFMRRTYTVLALANQALTVPEVERRPMLVAIDAIVDQTIASEAGGTDFLLPYAKAAPFRDPEAQSLFLDGELLLMMAARDRLEPRAATAPEAERRAARIVRQMRASPTLSGESYPDECWTFCNTTALAGLVLHDRAHRPLAADWVSYAKAHLVEPSTGILVSSYTYDGRVLDGPEGSSIWMTTSNLALLDPELARDQYARARSELRGGFAGFGWAREWPASAKGRPDVDSGPIVPLIDASAGSSGLALLGARAGQDDAWFDELFASVELAGFPAHGHYRTGNAVGDAVLAYAIAYGPLWERAR